VARKTVVVRTSAAKRTKRTAVYVNRTPPVLTTAREREAEESQFGYSETRYVQSIQQQERRKGMTCAVLERRFCTSTWKRIECLVFDAKKNQLRKSNGRKP